MPNDFSLAIYKHCKRDGGEVLVPLMSVLDEGIAKYHRYEFKAVFDRLSAMECSVGYDAVIRLRKRMNEKGLLSKLKEMFNYF